METLYSGGFRGEKTSGRPPIKDKLAQHHVWSERHRLNIICKLIYHKAHYRLHDIMGNSSLLPIEVLCCLCLEKAWKVVEQKRLAST